MACRKNLSVILQTTINGRTTVIAAIGEVGGWMMNELQLAEKLGWTPAKAEAEITAVREKFAELITREGAVEIIARQNGVEVAKPQASVAYMPLAECVALAESGQASFAARVWHVYAPKWFARKTEQGERRGRVCNVEVNDGTKARLVLWNRDVDIVEGGILERNDVVLVRNASVKKGQNGAELQSTLTTRISVVKRKDAGEYAKLLLNPVEPIAITELKASEPADVYGRVMDVTVASEFTRQDGNMGLRCAATLSDGGASVRAVAWDDNAKALEKCRVGDAVKIEGGFVKPREGGVELHCNWQARIIRNPQGHSLKERVEMLKDNYPKITLAEAAEGREALVTAKLLEIKGASVSRKCIACSEKLAQGAACKCGGQQVKETLVLRTVIDDGTANLQCTLFDKEALEMLELSELTVGAQAAVDIKRDYLLGKETLMLLRFRNNQYGELEAV
ncbi:MAG: OB-fold nucleic acid binding domain-containing protein, partial [Candidatus Micrarchaeota archaeon]